MESRLVVGVDVLLRPRVAVVDDRIHVVVSVRCLKVAAVSQMAIVDAIVHVHEHYLHQSLTTVNYVIV